MVTLTCAAVRIYGSPSYYGDTPWQPPPTNPIRLTDYPKKGSSTELHFGMVPKYVIDARKAGKALLPCFKGHCRLVGAARRACKTAS
jgi:hypothetical protein